VGSSKAESGRGKPGVNTSDFLSLFICYDLERNRKGEVKWEVGRRKAEVE